ncbi:MAG: Mut7-C RNAse domain-containing protein [Smithellaceae bacterium]
MFPEARGKTESRFITDDSLAGLAKWLWLPGIDTCVYAGEAGRPMMHLALQEDRTSLTSRRDTLERHFPGRLCLVPHINAGEQQKFVVSRFSLKFIPKKRAGSVNPAFGPRVPTGWLLRNRADRPEFFRWRVSRRVE